MSSYCKIGMLWVEGPLSYLEQLCIMSFLEVGHPVCLYTYHDVPNIPDGVEVRDARAILPASELVVHGRTGSPAPQSDMFRYRLLAAESGMIWADTDAYCLRPFVPKDGHYYGYLEGHVATGVLALPSDNRVLKMLIDATQDPHSIPPWLPPRHRKQIEQRRNQGERVSIPEIYWGIWGPAAFTWILRQTGEIGRTLPEHVFYPINFTRRRSLARPGADLDRFMATDTVSIHFYGRRIRQFLVKKYDGVPDPNSLIGKLMAKHRIEPSAAPLGRKAVPYEAGNTG